MANSSFTGSVAGYASGTQPGLVSTVAQTFAGKKTLDGGAAIKGDTSGSAIAAGYVGEVISQSRPTSSALSLTSATSANITASPLVITAGIWLISGNAFFNLSSTITSAVCGMSLTSATLPATSCSVPDSSGQIYVHNLPGTASGQAHSLVIPSYTVNITTSKTLYFVVNSTFAGSNNVNGFIQAVRIA